MYPPIFNVCNADAGVRALLLVEAEFGPELQIYPHGRAPQGVTYPYATWQVVAGSPENYLAGRPDMDGYTVQVNCYGKTGVEANKVAEAIRNAVELTAHIVSWRGDDTDPDTNTPFTSFDIDWLVNR